MGPNLLNFMIPIYSTTMLHDETSCCCATSKNQATYIALLYLDNHQVPLYYNNTLSLFCDDLIYRIFNDFEIKFHNSWITWNSKNALSSIAKDAVTALNNTLCLEIPFKLFYSFLLYQSLMKILPAKPPGCSSFLFM